MDKLRLFRWRRHTTFILIFGLLAILIGISISFIATHFKPTTQVHIGSGVFSLWLADTEEERVKGLSGVEGLGPNDGLLMAYDSDGLHGIWMKDMNFPLDIIWLDSAKKVVYIVKSAPPEEPAQTIYAPKKDSRYVIELPIGSVERTGIKIGDTARFETNV